MHQQLAPCEVAECACSRQSVLGFFPAGWRDFLTISQRPPFKMTEMFPSGDLRGAASGLTARDARLAPRIDRPDFLPALDGIDADHAPAQRQRGVGTTGWADRPAASCRRGGGGCPTGMVPPRPPRCK